MASCASLFPATVAFPVTRSRPLQAAPCSRPGGVTPSSGHVLRPHAWTDVTPRAERQDPDSPGPGARLLMRQQRWRKEQRPSAQ